MVNDVFSTIVGVSWEKEESFENGFNRFLRIFEAGSFLLYELIVTQKCTLNLENCMEVVYRGLIFLCNIWSFENF